MVRDEQITSVEVTVHRNQRPLQWTPHGETRSLKIHFSLLKAEADDLVDVLLEYQGAWGLVSAFFHPDPPKLRTQGQVYDLEVLAKAERARLPRETEALVGWGKWPSRAPRRGLRLGSCSSTGPAVIRVHPVLDHTDVPSWFVGFVVFHELLHLAVPPIALSGRRLVHPPSFRAAERLHPHFSRAERFEQQQITHWVRRCQDRLRR